MCKISVNAARSLAGILGKSSDANVRIFASALNGEADAAAAAGQSEFDLSTPATQTYQAATDALNAAIASN